MVTGVLLFGTFVLCALPLFVLGFLIKERRKLHLINGIDLNRVPDPDGLANWLGLACYRLAGLTLAAGLSLAFAPVFAFPILLIYGVATLVAAWVFLRGIARHQRPVPSL